MNTTSCAAASKALSARLSALRQWLDRRPGPAQPWPADLRALLEETVRDCAEAETAPIEPALRRLSALTEIWECAGAEGDESHPAEEVLFVTEAIERLAGGCAGGSAADAVRWVVTESDRRWGKYLSLLEPQASALTAQEPEWTSLPADEPSAIGSDQLLRLLLASASGEASAAEEAEPSENVSSPGVAHTDQAVCPAGAETSFSSPAGQMARPSLPPELSSDLRESFLAEAAEIADRLQNLLFQLPRGDLSEVACEVKRTLHTLKGAAGCVGLSQFASLVHDLEEKIAGSVASGPETLGRWLEAALKAIEECVGQLRHPAVPASKAEETVGDPVVKEIVPARAPEIPFEAESTLRIATERIEGLSALVQEIVSRGRFWNEQAQHLRARATALQACRGRLAAGLERFQDAIRLHGERKSEPADPAAAALRIEEQVADLSLLAAELRSASLTQADEFEHAQRTCEQLWAALQAIRIVPVRGLLQRLARAARDAAMVEGRLVDLELAGEDCSLDRSIQERAFQPLLHVVRNAVGHGIEPADERSAAGKSPTGRVRIAAHPQGHQMVFEVADDGRGLDHAAIESKARRLGWLAGDEHPTAAQLHALVFRPGFSTREQANTIAGRGLGLDVALNEIRRMRGSIELDSRPGKGTRVSVHVPTRLALAHMMIVQADDQLFCLPIDLIQSVTGPEPGGLASASTSVPTEGVRRICLRSVFGLNRPVAAACPIVVIAHGLNESVALAVDSIEGIQELVVKPLPALLHDHPALAGVCFTMQGELVQVLNPEGVCQLASGSRHSVARPGQEPTGPTALMVDDSLSARASSTRVLKDLGFQVDEAADGVEALSWLRRRPYDLLLTDLEMPRGDGFELLGELRRDRERRSMKVVVVSSRGDPGIEARVLGLGADAFLTKPADADRLARTVRSLVSLENAPIRETSRAGGG